jgi:hypothetical protein
MSLFLTTDDLAELTGIKVGKAGKSREQRQVQALRTMGIPFWVNAIGRPVVAKAAIEGRGQAEAPPTNWQPAVLGNAA